MNYVTYKCVVARIFLQFVTSHEDTFKVKSALEKRGTIVQQFTKEFVVTAEVQLAEGLVNSIEQGCELIKQTLEDTDKIYTNIANLT